jgi:hypothetical protein
MVYVLKVILFLLCVGMGLATRFVYLDYKGIKQTEGFDELSIWQKIRFNFTFFSIFSSIVSLIVFLAYFIFVTIKIG